MTDDIPEAPFPPDHWFGSFGNEHQEKAMKAKSVWVLLEWQWGRENPEQIVAMYDSHDKAASAEADRKATDQLDRKYYVEQWPVQ